VDYGVADSVMGPTRTRATRRDRACCVVLPVVLGPGHNCIILGRRMVRPSTLFTMPDTNMEAADVLGQTHLDAGWSALLRTHLDAATYCHPGRDRVIALRARHIPLTVDPLTQMDNSNLDYRKIPGKNVRCLRKRATNGQQPDEWQQDLNPDPMAGQNYGLEGSHRRKMPQRF